QYPSTNAKSMNQLWTLVLRALTASRARSLKVTGDRPGTQDRHFWVPEYTASSPQSSTSNGVPPSEVTASTMVRQPCRCASAAKVWASDCAPVEVSACTNARTLA